MTSDKEERRETENIEKKTHNRTHKTHIYQDIIEVGLIIISSHIIIVLNRRLSQRSNWKSKDRPASDIDRSPSKSQSAAPPLVPLPETGLLSSSSTSSYQEF